MSGTVDWLPNETEHFGRSLCFKLDNPYKSSVLPPQMVFGKQRWNFSFLVGYLASKGFHRQYCLRAAFHCLVSKVSFLQERVSDLTLFSMFHALISFTVFLKKPVSPREKIHFSSLGYFGQHTAINIASRQCIVTPKSKMTDHHPKSKASWTMIRILESTAYAIYKGLIKVVSCKSDHCLEKEMMKTSRVLCNIEACKKLTYTL
ncbi:hypothetical protein EDD85DRAFT_794103 [Armillaria nabsnona]|nr:hypothetical protein EDD85DRAFT_794103 [Armillaria nabsnona]